MPARSQQPNVQASGSGVDNAWKIHSAIVDWTGKVDSKASFALALESAAIATTVALTASGRRLSELPAGRPTIVFWTGLVSLLLAALIAATVVIPRLRSRPTKDDWKDNFIYFGHLRFWNPDDLAKALKERDILTVLSRQIVNMSGIAWRKHRRVQASLAIGIVGAGLVVLSAFLR